MSEKLSERLEACAKGEEALCSNVSNALLREAAAVLRAVEGGARDAERYRWLRDNIFPHAYFDRKRPHVVMTVYLGHDERGRLNVMRPGREAHVGIPSLDQAIAAARALSGETT